MLLVELAETLRRPASTVRRQLAEVLGSEEVTIRCELAQQAGGWPISVTWWCRVPSDTLKDLVGKLAGDSRIRMCLSLTGPANIAIAAWVKDTVDLMECQSRIERWITPGVIIGSSVVLRTIKRNGRILRSDGTATAGSTPISLAL